MIINSLPYYIILPLSLVALLSNAPIETRESIMFLSL